MHSLRAAGAVIADVGTAEYLAGALQSGLPMWAMPALVSLLCYVISFACGSSIGTMGIVRTPAPAHPHAPLRTRVRCRCAHRPACACL